MAKATITITVDPDSELARALSEAAETPVRLDVRGVRYRVRREDADPFADYDPEQVRRSLAQYAGSWGDIDAEALKAYVYRGREEGTSFFLSICRRTCSTPTG
jgi:hypothetical protein